jgi:hypothetical protein
MTLRLRSGRAPHPCFETNKALEEAARRAAERKNQALDRLMGKLGPNGRFEQAMHGLIDADRRALKEKGK